MEIIIFKDQKQNIKIIINNFKRFWGFGGKAKINKIKRNFKNI
jgi:hypothetical protein